MGLYQKHRPTSLDNFFGNEDLVQTLRGLLSKKKVPHAILFHGPTGCGKTTLARIIAKELGCQEDDINEIDSAQFRGIDTIRELHRNIRYNPLSGESRVYIIDEVHSATKDAQNAMLKIFEDTPEHVYFILCTTDPQKLLPTVKGRCSQFQVSTLDDLQLKTLLKQVVREEGERLQKSVYAQIIKDSQGHPRNALTILEQVLSVEADKRLAVAKKSAEEHSEGIALARALMQGKGWKEISAILRGVKQQDPEGIRRIIIGYAATVLASKEDGIAGLLLEQFIEPFYNSGWPGLVSACYLTYLTIHDKED